MQLDRGILLAILFLLGLGLVQVYSSSYIYATEVHGNGLLFFHKQLVFVLAGVFATFSVAMIPWKYAERAGWVLWGVAVLGVLLTYFPGVGVKVGGAHRWLNLPLGFRFEPGELLRVTYPFVLAPLIVAFGEDEIDRRWWIRLGLVLSPLLLILRQPDFGTFVIVIGLVTALFIAFGLRWRFVILAGGSLVGLVSLLIATSDYRRLRFETFLNPWADPAEKGFQVIQSMVGLYSGGLTGVGLGQGQAKLFFLPEAHTDFTLAVLGEEMGFIGVFFLLLVYGFLVFRGFQISLLSQSFKHRALGLSFTLLLAIAVFINVGVSLGLLPTKGLTLPLISYGGSSLISTCLMMGWMLNLSREQMKCEQY